MGKNYEKNWKISGALRALSLAMLAACGDTAQNARSAQAEQHSPVRTEDASCIEVDLGEYNLFLLEDYNGGHDVMGKVAAGGDIGLTDFAVGAGLTGDISNTLVAGGDLTLSRGGVWGDARYGGNYSADQTVVYPRGSAAQGTPIDFAERGSKLKQLSSQLAGLTANGTTTRENWGGLFLRGTDPKTNVFEVNASAFTGAKLLSIEAPANSLAVVNIRGASATFTGFGQTFGGGIDQQGVLFNFVDATGIEAHGYGFWGTVLAPLAHITFNDGSWDGGIYAKSLTGNAEGHINPLKNHTVCPGKCVEVGVRLGEYNLFLLEDYNGGHDVMGKVAAGGDIGLTDFAVGAGLTGDISNTLVAGGDLTLSRGGVWGDARYGGNYSADQTVVYPRGSAAQGTPIDFAERGSKLKQLSSQLAGLTANGTTTRENWGGLFLRGTDPKTNVFEVNASAFTGAKLLSIEAPANSLAVVNIRGASATFTGFGQTFGGGIDQQGVLFNFVDATGIEAHGYGFWGTVLAPLAHITFNDGSWDGGIYAKSLTGNAEGHINPLKDRDLCL
ncbi:choice-of-anchor A family protein [Stigmatella sp. ncwal1]|uniref:Choice-of-anchor A family protein n=1 Tax=Stigmatella ashevillensis TaxID=2995309 RepID=A0ABT5DJ27_9BACT|nr:choice-of-anchor A family protein [Stigmatella ashevillena]MDC0713165.1 choice-of-anchor A family protein [Stigmatella ashevillena]